MYAMKFFLFLTGLFFFGQSSDSVTVSPEIKPAAASPAKNFEINTYDSHLTWQGSLLIGGEFQGTIAMQSGTLTLENNQVKAAKFTIDMNTIKSTDLKEEDKNRELEGLLKSDAFFSVRHFPVSYFAVTRAVTGVRENELMITGSLVINGVANEVSFPARLEVEGEKVRLKALVTFDRTRWGINYKSLDFFSAVRTGLIDSEIKLNLDLAFDEVRIVGC